MQFAGIWEAVNTDRVFREIRKDWNKWQKGLVCIDTDVCVDFLRKKEPGFTPFIKLLERFEPCITAITAFELYLGHIRMKRTEQIVDFITQFTVLPFDIKTAETSARIHAALGKKR